MAHGLEVRVPLLGQPVIDFALRQPAAVNLKGRPEIHFDWTGPQGIAGDCVESRKTRFRCRCIATSMPSGKVWLMTPSPTLRHDCTFPECFCRSCLVVGWQGRESLASPGLYRARPVVVAGWEGDGCVTRT